MINIGDGLVALNTVKELMADRGRPYTTSYEVALWADMLRVQGDELFYAYMVDIKPSSFLRPLTPSGRCPER